MKSQTNILGIIAAVVVLSVCSGCQSGLPAPDLPQINENSAIEQDSVEQDAVEQDSASSEITPAELEAEEPVLRVGDLLAEADPPTDPPTEAEAAPSADAASNNDESLGDTTPSQPRFEMGDELTISTLLNREIVGSEITFEQTLANGENYAQYIASYLSEGYRIYGLLTVPLGDPPPGGYKAVVFNHGFIPPSNYQTTERYVAYVDALARSGLVVFKIDLRGHGNSEGEASGTYFSPTYTVDAISALKSLQTLDFVDPQGIGMWGHSMAGNLVLRSMLIEPEIKAGAIWAGAVYSYDDFVRYEIDDPSASETYFERSPAFQRGREIREFYGPPNTEAPYWQAVSLTRNLESLQAPLQLHHAVNDDVVNIGYSIDLAAVLTAEGKAHEFFQYDGGGHNIGTPSFTAAMQRTIAFFLANL